MKYQSSRGGVVGATFEDTLFSGYAPDGGLFVPEKLPVFPESVRSKWKESPPSFQDVVFEVVKLFVDEDELPRDVLKRCINEAYGKFDTENVLEFQDCKISSDQGAPTYRVAEMFHGKTKAFKDYALSLVGKFVEYYVQKSRRQVTILVGTSGDTGSAAIEGVRGLKGVDIIVLYPKGKISKVQELQMTTVTENNVHVFETEGTSDDLDEPIKRCFPSPGVISINSVNWARIMIQVSHYIYISAIEKFEPVDIYVPTGGCGNLAGGLVASLLGFPVNLYTAQNVNDNVEKLINKGELLMGGKITETYANAMDIRTPYNVERLLYFVSDAATVSKIMTACEAEEKAVAIPDELLKKLRALVKGGTNADAATILDTIKNCWTTNNYLICPHTATAVASFIKNVGESRSSLNKVYVIATASPEKFPDAAKAAKISGVPESKSGEALLKELMTLKVKQPKVMKKGEDWFKILKDEIRNLG